ncbi:MAG: hypothetical protein MK198_12585, partial [Gracilimonas sp.]|uniref:hypothetical protein n=1 Tax=Gracilimonas sp. TaxID=1974203 RepID=UPI0037517F9A|nr:hypothetical protein [Gracilimonas sp.]
NSAPNTWRPDAWEKLRRGKPNKSPEPTSCPKNYHHLVVHNFYQMLLRLTRPNDPAFKRRGDCDFFEVAKLIPYKQV